jgi:hypothetical protein
MSKAYDNTSVIRSAAVRLVAQPTLIDCASKSTGAEARTLAVVPLLDGDRIAGFEIRCSCGSSAVVECVYEKEA